MKQREEKKSVEAPCRRHGGRLQQETLSCSLGPVIDVSISGMRVMSSEYPSGRLKVEIFHCDGSTIVECEVVRVSKKSARSYEIGLRFHDESPLFATTIAEIARCHRVGRTVL